MTAIDTTELVHLPLDQLDEHPDNLRADVGDLTDMVASIHAVGIIQPLVVTPNGALFTVLAGHRRLAAARQAGLQLVPCVVRPQFDDADATEVFLIENLQRSGLNPIEEGTGYARLAECGLSQREIAERVGCNQSHVSKRIKLTTLPDVAQALVVRGDLDIADALQLAALVELDAGSADEWCAAALKDGIRGSHQPWPSITERLRRATVEQRRAAAEAEGKASGLKVMRNADRLVDFEECDRDAATHWIVNVHGELVWLVRRVEAPAAINPTKQRESDKPKPAPVPVVDAEGVADEPEASTDWGDRVGHANGHELYNDRHGHLWIVKRETSGHGDQAYLLLRVTTEFVDAFQRKWEAARAIGLGVERSTELIEADRSDRCTSCRGDSTIVDPISGDEEPYTCPDCGGSGLAADQLDPATMEEAEAQAFAEDEADEWDHQRTTAPWKAYAFVSEVQLVGGIREHTNPAKLRWAQIYEAANKNRPLVLTALDERLAELEA